MKTTIKIIIFLLIIQPIYAQKQRIKGNQLFITNKVTHKSVKIGTSENTLKNFGSTLIKTDTLDMMIEPSSHHLRYTYNNILFYVSTSGKISTFETRSSDIAIEVKGKFTYSPGDHISDLATTFPDEVADAQIMHRGIERNEYLGVWVQLSGFNETYNKYVDLDCAIVFLLSPETKVIEEIFYWIRP